MGLGIVPMIIYTYLLPEESFGNSNRPIIVWGIIISIILALVTFFLSPIAVSYFFQDYVASIVVIQILAFGIIPLTIITILNAKLQSQQSKRVGIGALVRIGSHLILIPFLWNMLEMEGLALAAIFSILIHMIYLIAIYYKSESHLINKI